MRAATLRATTLVSALLCGLGIGACFDWTVRSGASTDDAGPDVSRPPDAQIAEAGELDGSATPEVEAGPVDCPALVDETRAARKSARTCQLASGHCATKVRDECDCDVFIAVGGSNASEAFVAKAAETRAAGCTSHCAATCPSLPVQGGCVQVGTDLTCSP